MNVSGHRLFAVLSPCHAALQPVGLILPQTWGPFDLQWCHRPSWSADSFAECSVTCCIRVFPSQLIQSPVTTPLGLIMLKTTSEELACPREDLSVARKEELRKLLLDQVQTVLGLLTGTSSCTCSVNRNVLLHHAQGASKLTRSGAAKQCVGDGLAAPAVGTLKSTLQCLGQLTTKQAGVAEQLL